MRLAESISSAPHIAESAAFTSAVVGKSKLGRVRNTVLAITASLPFIVNGGMEASAAPGQSTTTSRDEGPKCVEVFVTTYGDIGSNELSSQTTSAAGANSSELGIRSTSDEVGNKEANLIGELRNQLSLNAARALQGEPVEAIILDCSIWAGSEIEVTSS